MAEPTKPADPGGVLHTKYRPRAFKDVVGQDAVVKAMQKVIDRDGSHCFLLSGPSGVGKTTLARIAARALGCVAADILEIDAATFTGVENMRQVQDGVRYRPLGRSDTKVVIVDECHMASKAAWNSLLKVTEEPPAHVYWFFCTTEASKVPATMKTRASSFTLKPVPDKELGKIFDRVCEAEGINVSGDVGDMIIREAHGSPRQMLSNLELCQDADNKREAADILRVALESDAVIELCRFLIAGRGSWIKVMATVAKLDTENPESVRIIVSNYMASAIKNAKSDKEAIHILGVLDAFANAYNQSDRMAPLILSIGRVLFAGG